MRSVGFTGLGLIATHRRPHGDHRAGVLLRSPRRRPRRGRALRPGLFDEAVASGRGTDDVGAVLGAIETRTLSGAARDPG
ncbi:hypothetical protein ACFPM0_20925 [Pseudonocardia sulfidoxydans]|uniref:hypothetical protein n=1 Tax=Pseudonocardia sulfidoxydans TaxID=54011 RepID=UPI003622A0AA